MSDVILVQCRTGMDIASTCAPPHSLLCVAAPLDHAGYDVKIIDQRVNPDWKQDLLEELDTEPIWVGFTAMTGTNIKFVMEASKIVREYSRVPIVWGGPHPTLLAEQILASGLSDYIVKRECDETICEITSKIANKTQSKRIIDNPLPDVEKLLPTPWHLIDVESYVHPDMYVKNGRRTMDLGQTSRGCPHQCVVEGTIINVDHHRGSNIEGMYDKHKKIIGYADNHIVDSQIIKGEESIAEEVLELTIEDGRTLVLTLNHPVFTKRGWVNAGELKEDDEVLTICNPYKNRIFKQCSVCGKYKYMETDSKYCSIDCRNKHNKPRTYFTKLCSICNKTFITRRVAQIYCGKSCATINKNRGRDISGENNITRFPGAREKMSACQRGDKNVKKRPGVIEKAVATYKRHGYNVECSIRMKRLHQDPQFREKCLNALKRHPNNNEKNLSLIIESNSLPFKFVGDFKYWVPKCKSGKCRNPDFIDTNHQHKVILAHGDYYHREQDKNDIELEDYLGRGYKVLIIWEHDVKDKNKESEIVSRIREFFYGN